MKAKVGNYVCPKCQGPKSNEATLCVKCANAGRPVLDPMRYRCKCGAPKSRMARMCVKCYDRKRAKEATQNVIGL